MSTVDIRGNAVTLSVECGIVAGVQRLSETHVSGNVSGGSGNVSGSISSTIIRRTEFAVIGDDGVERPHHFSSHDMFLRNGNRVSLIYASARRREWAYIVNHDTGNAYNPWSSVEYVYRLGIVRAIRFKWFVPFMIGFFILMFVDGGAAQLGVALFPVSAVGSIVLPIIQRSRAYWTWRKHLRPKFEQIKDRLLQSSVGNQLVLQHS